MSMLREFKAKKAKYGFTTEIGGRNVVALGMFIAAACRGAKLGQDFTIEDTQSGGSHDVKIYTNDEGLAAQIRRVNALEIPSDTQAFLMGGNLYKKSCRPSTPWAMPPMNPKGPTMALPTRPPSPGLKSNCTTTKTTP